MPVRTMRFGTILGAGFLAGRASHDIHLVRYCLKMLHIYATPNTTFMVNF